MDISECEILPSGERRYNTLYRYNISMNTVENGQTVICGEFIKPSVMSESPQGSSFNTAYRRIS